MTFSFRDGNFVSIRTFILSDQKFFKLDSEAVEQACKRLPRLPKVDVERA